MENYKSFYDESSLSLETATKFSIIASWVTGMRDFSKELTFPFSEYFGKSYSLKEYNMKTSASIENLLARRSNREFTSDSVSLLDFSFILNNSLGVSFINETGVYFTYPSSGGIQSIIPIVLVNNIEGIEQGVYYYEAKQFILYRISDFNKKDYDKITSSLEIACHSAFSIHLFVAAEQKCYKY